MRHFFPELIPLLKETDDPRHQSYIDYPRQVLLYVRIMAAVFHIRSMRKMTEDFNNETVIDNIRYMLAIESLGELPHWSTINDYLERLNPNELERIIPKLVKRLIRMHTFDGSRIRNKYWQTIVDGTELHNTN